MILFMQKYYFYNKFLLRQYFYQSKILQKDLSLKQNFKIYLQKFQNLF